MSIFGTIQPKPRNYRTATGQFRRETPQEFRARHDDDAWAFSEAQRIHFTAIANRVLVYDPWLELLSGAKHGS